MNFLKNQKGLSLIEMILAVTIFTFAFLMATTIFQSVVEGQRSAISAQSTQEAMSYAFEIMSKEIRYAQKVNSSECSILLVSNELYTTIDGGQLHFKNKNNECVIYYEDSGRLKITRCKKDNCAATTVDLEITPDEIEISNLNFIVYDNPSPSYLTGEQPKVTFSMDAQMAGGREIHKQPIKIQTTISSRYYE